jgi:hypothetical protein
VKLSNIFVLASVGFATTPRRTPVGAAIERADTDLFEQSSGDHPPIDCRGRPTESTDPTVDWPGVTGM